MILRSRHNICKCGGPYSVSYRENFYRYSFSHCHHFLLPRLQVYTSVPRSVELIVIMVGSIKPGLGAGIVANSWQGFKRIFLPGNGRQCRSSL